MKTVRTYGVQLVKESSKLYDVKTRMTSPDDAYDVIKKVTGIETACEEYVYMLAVDAKNRLIGVSELSHGGLDMSIMSPREIFKRAILMNASSIFVVHNHPSGDANPSSTDIEATGRIALAANILGIRLLDHLIIGDGTFISLRQTNPETFEGDE